MKKTVHTFKLSDIVVTIKNFIVNITKLTFSSFSTTFNFNNTYNTYSTLLFILLAAIKSYIFYTYYYKLYIKQNTTIELFDTNSANKTIPPTTTTTTIPIYSEFNKPKGYNRTITKNNVTKMERPFLNVYDDKGRRTNIVLITHPFSREDCIKNYNKGKSEGIQYLGISSYCDFPNKPISNPHDAMHDPKHLAWTYDYFTLCKGWLHCFREPDKYIPHNHPKLLLSESDFAKYNKHKPIDNVKKEYDFLYVCLKDNDKCEPGWQSYNRNWELAEKCLDIMCNKFHLKGLLIGRINCKLPDKCHKLMESTDFLQYDKFISMYPKCRFAFVPNKLDASPRVMTEAICYNMPVLCNYHITGGWKYITEKTGELFNVDGSDSGNDFEDVLRKFLQNYNTYTPRDEYIKNHNEADEGKQLLDFCMSTIGKDNVNFTPETLGGDVKYLVPGV